MSAEPELLMVKPRPALLLPVVAALFLFQSAATTDAQGPAGLVSAAFDRYWQARTTDEAAAAAGEVIASGASFDDAVARLRQGRTYSADVPRGIVAGSHTAGGTEFRYTIDVPPTYDPARRYQVRVQLHGGITRPEPVVRGSGGIGALAGDEQIYVLPIAWRDAPWWNAAQIGNLDHILDGLKRTYNVDENRVVVAGVSDGGTGAYYVAMRQTTPYAAFLPLNGFIMILAQPSVGLREPVFPNNLRTKPFFIVNGGRDQLYPTSLVDPYIRHFERGGVNLTYRPQAEGQHNTAWWPEVRPEFEGFIRDHPRAPHPATLTWQAPAGGGRAHWIVIDAIAPPRADDPLPDLNERVAGTEPNFGVRASGMRVTAVLAGTNAEVMGLLPDDLVLSINGRNLPPPVPLLDLLSIEEPGAPLRLVVSRGAGTVELSGTYRPTLIPRTESLFSRRGPSGRIDASRDGNTVTVTTRGVATFTVLLSPDVFNFASPITVVADGRTVFQDRVAPSVATLMKWAARDNDRTMLYGAEVTVTLAP